MLRKNKLVQQQFNYFLELTTLHKEIIVICNNAFYNPPQLLDPLLFYKETIFNISVILCISKRQTIIVTVLCCTGCLKNT